MQIPLTSVQDAGVAIRTMRKRAGIRIDDFALIAGVSKQFMTDLENGKVTVQMGMVLGLLQQSPAAWFERGSSSDDDARIQALIDERVEAKKSRDFARADAIRQQLADEGVLLEDTVAGVRWKRA